MNLPEDMSKRIAVHLEQVGEQLGYLPLTEPQSRLLLQLIEFHIHEELESRTSDAPTLQALEAVLKEMDSPEAYAPNLASPPVKQRSLSRPTAEEIEKSPLKKVLSTAVFLMALIALVGLAVFYLKHRASTDEQPQAPVGHSLDFAFIDDPAVHGIWVCVDYVKTIDGFQPDMAQTQKDKLLLEDLNFMPGGETEHAWLKWTAGLVLHTGDQTVNRYLLRKISDTPYMFLEWKSGGKTQPDGATGFHVLKQPNPTDGAIIEEGIGWDAFTIGAGSGELIARLGEPIKGLQRGSLRWEKIPGIDVIIDSSGECRELRFGKGFAGATSKGVHVNSALREAYRAYGPPARSGKKGAATILEWPVRGIRLWASNDRITQIIVFAPKARAF